MLRTQTRTYWQNRTRERVTAVEAQAVPYIKQVNKIYADARRDLIKDMQAVYRGYYKSQGWDIEKLQSIAPTGDLEQFKRQLKANGLITKLPKRYKGRLTRLELIYAQLWQGAKVTGLKELAIANMIHPKSLKSSYYISVYNVSKGLTRTPAFTQLSEPTIERLLTTRFYGKNYSERIWGNTNQLAKDLQNVVSRGIMTGQSTQKMSQNLRQRYDVAKWKADRLIGTETNHFENLGANESYKSMSIGQWQWLATLDSSTDADCQVRDGKVYDVNHDTRPPLHANCRCAATPYLGKGFTEEVRITRGKDGKNYYVPDMTYEQWFRQYGD